MALALAVLLLSPAAARADVQLSISNGQVNLKATNATVREILAEWGRVGHTQIVNGDKVSGPPMTILLTNEPEDKALQTILRSAGGYVAAPREVEMMNASRFDRILLMPPGPPPTRSAAPPPAAFPQPRFTPPPVDDDDTGNDEPPAPNVVLPNPRGPVFNTYPQPNTEPAAPSGTSAPAGVSRPGMVVPAPAAQPGQAPPGGQPAGAPEPEPR